MPLIICQGPLDTHRSMLLLLNQEILYPACLKSYDHPEVTVSGFIRSFLNIHTSLSICSALQSHSNLSQLLIKFPVRRMRNKKKIATVVFKKMSLGKIAYTLSLVFYDKIQTSLKGLFQESQQKSYPQDFLGLKAMQII